MELITRSQLRSVRNKFANAKGVQNFLPMINESKTRKSTAAEISVFLSHKHEEKEELIDAIALLKFFGVNIYIDHNDEEMPKETSGVTADKIKKKIIENNKFILIATENAIASKWCNWELGFGDAQKYINNIAILIVKEDNANWSGSEYLQIYPVICKNYSWKSDSYVVKFPDGRIVDLNTWLS